MNKPLDATDTTLPPSADGMISIFIVADQDIFVDGLIRIISDQPDHHVVACISAGDGCFKRFSETPADLLLIDQTVVEQKLKNVSIDELFSEFTVQYPDLRIIVFGHKLDYAFVRRMIRAGTHGLFDSTMTRETLSAAIREVHAGGFWVGREALEMLIYSAVEMERIIEQGIREKIDTIQDTLTRREADVLQRVLEGMSTRQIASDLFLSEQSVKLHLGRLFRKFDVTNRSQLILIAFQRVCPVNNMIQLFRKTLDKKRIANGREPVIRDPLDEPR